MHVRVEFWQLVAVLYTMYHYSCIVQSQSALLGDCSVFSAGGSATVAPRSHAATWLCASPLPQACLSDCALSIWTLSWLWHAVYAD